LKNVAIVGGGLAGLISGIELTKKGVPCRLFERKNYPYHRVCGEYISNEALPYLKKNNLYPDHVKISQLTQFQLSSVSGESATMPLDMGGFGISRYQFDHFLAEKLKALGVEIHENCEVNDISFKNDGFTLHTSNGIFGADAVIGTFGKRSKLDIQMQRAFTQKRSPYVGVKYHVQSGHAPGLIALHNFDGGYCGVSNIEDGLTNVCYLVERNVLQAHGSLDNMQKNVLSKNPLIEKIFLEATFKYDKPLVINEISFETKAAVENHVLMAGDAAGMIAPLCGNGMAIAIHGGILAAMYVADFCDGKISRMEMEQHYSKAWKKTFAQRLSFGRNVQRLFGNRFLSRVAVNITLHSKPLSRLIMRNTHGEVF
jgi:menaquinone-9 beta-reductase